MKGGLQEDQLLERDHPGEEPLTEYESKTVMLRAERHDEISVSHIVTHLSHSRDVPNEITVVQRTTTYFGPKIVTESGGQNYLLTAPGPDTQLLLWAESRGSDGFRKGWEKLAEVTVEFSEDQPKYDLCPICGDPLKTLEHEREAAFGSCPNEGV